MVLTTQHTDETPGKRCSNTCWGDWGRERWPEASYIRVSLCVTFFQWIQGNAPLRQIQVLFLELLEFLELMDKEGQLYHVAHCKCTVNYLSLPKQGKGNFHLPFLQTSLFSLWSPNCRFFAGYHQVLFHKKEIGAPWIIFLPFHKPPGLLPSFQEHTGLENNQVPSIQSN